MPAGRGGRGPLPRDVQVSKKMSWLLRHGAETEGIKMQDGGYVNVQDMLRTSKFKSLKVTFAELRDIVTNNDKQRFTLAPNPSPPAGASTIDDPSSWLIRANQGHSIKVESEGLLKAITPENLPDTAVHGTTHAAWCQIVSSGGLKPMGRNHVHFASGLPAGFTSIAPGDDAGNNAPPVISGMRNSSTVLVFLDLVKAMDAGIKFWVSENGVILTEGNGDGIVPLDFFARVEDRTGEGVLVENGRVVKQSPSEWSKKKGGAMKE